MHGESDHSRSTTRWNAKSLYTLVEQAPFGVYTVDADLRIVQINAYAQDRAFRNVRPAVGRDLGDALGVLWPQDVAESIVRVFEQTLASGTPYYSDDYVQPRADIDIVEAYEWELHRISLPDGQLGVAAYFYDTTQLREAELALRRSEALLRKQKEALQAAVNGAPLEASLDMLVDCAIEQLGGDTRAAFFLVDSDGSALYHVTGMGEEYAQAVDGFPVGPDAVACGLAVHTGEPVLYADVFKEPACAQWLHLAERFDYHATWSFPLLSSGGKVVGSFCIYSREPRSATPRDIEVAQSLTHAAAIIMSRHQATQQRAQAEQALRDANRCKDEFLAMLAHELRNPLAAIRNAGQSLLHAEGDAQLIRSAATILNRQVNHMVHQVDDLLDVSRISQGKIVLRKEPTELAQVVNHAVESNRPLCEGLGHDLSVTLPARSMRVMGDPVRLTQVVSNLLNNACKFTSPGGAIAISVAREDAQAVIRVRDNGIGIAPSETTRVFDTFMQIDKSLGRARDGLGLGLSLVKKLVQLHDGSVEVHSDGLGKGSEFVVRLPLLVAPFAAKEPAPAPAAAPAEEAHRVLVVDDNRDSAASLAMLLQLMGQQVDTAHDGEEAVDKALSTHADLVLLDIGLPGLDGYAAARKIRELAGPAAPRLVALTGWGQDDARRRSEEAGFSAHLVKPVDLAVLTKLLDELD
jgi:signal transduction histidine kinase/CheY-like chemotaxis protein/PAS domain-containing protein